jgi:hypothetical protein
MTKILTSEEIAEQDILRAAKKARVLARRAAKKVESIKIKNFKHRMEIIRTACAIFAVVLNLAVLTHILGFW